MQVRGSADIQSSCISVATTSHDRICTCPSYIHQPMHDATMESRVRVPTLEAQAQAQPRSSSKRCDDMPASRRSQCERASQPDAFAFPVQPYLPGHSRQSHPGSVGSDLLPLLINSPKYRRQEARPDSLHTAPTLRVVAHHEHSLGKQERQRWRA